MPRTKNLQHYPARYSEIVRECAIQGKRIEICGMAARQANSLRGHWYAYIGALKAEAAKMRGLPPTPGALDIIELAQQAPMTMIQVIDIGNGLCNVVWQNRELSWQAQAVAGATVTDAGGAVIPPQSLDSVAARLAAIQQEVDHKGGDDHGK